MSTPAIGDLALRVMEARIELVRLATDIVADHTANLRFERRNLERGSPRQRIERQRQAVRELALRARRGQRSSLDQIRGGITLQRNLLRSLNPDRILQRGYAAISHADTGVPVLSVAQAAVEDVLHVQFADGAVLSRIEARAASSRLPAEVSS